MRFKYLKKFLEKSTKEQIDAYSRYLHSLSLAALIAVVGMPFSDVEIIMFEIKALALIFISIIMLIMGSNLLKERVSG